MSFFPSLLKSADAALYGLVPTGNASGEDGAGVKLSSLRCSNPSTTAAVQMRSFEPHAIDRLKVNREQSVQERMLFSRRFMVSPLVCASVSKNVQLLI